MSAQQARIERSLERLGFQLGKGRGRAFKVTAAGGGVAPITYTAAAMGWSNSENRISF